MDDIKTDGNKEKKQKLILWRRFIFLIWSFLKLIWQDLHKLLLNIIDKNKRKALWKKIWSFLNILYKKIMEESILMEAAALTYITVLGFVPFLLLVVFLLPKISVLAAQTKFSLKLYENLMPGSTADIANILSGLISKQVSYNIFSLVITIITSYSLFTVIRDAFDRILMTEFQPPKNLISQLLKFFGTIIFGFIIILLLFSSSSLPIISSLLNIALFRQYLIFLFPFILQFLALVFLYMIVPSIKVKRSALFRGAFWTTLIWVIAKSGFDYYVYNLTNYEMIYGVLKSLPIFLFWIYVNWVIILGGMVLVTVIENKEKALTKVSQKHFVRVTLEMFTDKKMDKEVEAVLTKENAAELIEELTKEKTE
ncbi:MAG: YihY/virulence factor BrkB family protein [Candidatus Cloacimonadaceae bacterium]